MFRFVLLCILWYTSSALTNTSSKAFLNALDAPVTLTLVQFLFVAIWTSALALAGSRLRTPGLRSTPIRPLNRHIVTTTIPMSLFVLSGHLFSAFATSKIPVSTVHTIKALSPIFTVAAYSSLLGIRYTKKTHAALGLLTLGVMLACSGSMATNGDYIGLSCALGSTVIFVSQNIFSKRIMNHEKHDEPAERRLDKMNLLFFSSAGAFLLMLPIWFFQESKRILARPWERNLVFELIFNGTSHASQNILAFSLLNMVSPVTYSIASLIKRIFVIVVSIIWFGQETDRVQGIGIAMTACGLYLYDRAREDVSRVDREVEKLDIRETLPVHVTHDAGSVPALRANGTASWFRPGRLRAPSPPPPPPPPPPLPSPGRPLEKDDFVVPIANAQLTGLSNRRSSTAASERSSSVSTNVRQNGMLPANGTV